MTYAGIRTSLVKDGIIPKLVKLLKKAQFRHVALKLVKALPHHFTHFTTRYIYQARRAEARQSSVALLYSLYY